MLPRPPFTLHSRVRVIARVVLGRMREPTRGASVGGPRRHLRVTEFPAARADFVDLRSGAYFRILPRAAGGRLQILEGRIAVHARDIQRLLTEFPDAPLSSSLAALGSTLSSGSRLPPVQLGGTTPALLWATKGRSRGTLLGAELRRVVFSPAPGARLVRFEVLSARRV